MKDFYTLLEHILGKHKIPGNNLKKFDIFASWICQYAQTNNCNNSFILLLPCIKRSTYNKLGWTKGNTQREQKKSRVTSCDDTTVIQYSKEIVHFEKSQRCVQSTQLRELSCTNEVMCKVTC